MEVATAAMVGARTLVIAAVNGDIAEHPMHIVIIRQLQVLQQLRQLQVLQHLPRIVEVVTAAMAIAQTRVIAAVNGVIAAHPLIIVVTVHRLGSTTFGLLNGITTFECILTVMLIWAKHHSAGSNSTSRS